MEDTRGRSRFPWMPTWAPGASRAPSSVVERHSRTLQASRVLQPFCSASAVQASFSSGSRDTPSPARYLRASSAQARGSSPAQAVCSAATRSAERGVRCGAASAIASAVATATIQSRGTSWMRPIPPPTPSVRIGFGMARSRAVRKEKANRRGPLRRRQRQLRADLLLVHLRPVVPRAALLLLLYVPLDATGCDQQHPRSYEGDEPERQVPTPVGRILLQQSSRRRELRRVDQPAHILRYCGRD